MLEHTPSKVGFMRHVHRVVIIVALIGPVTISVACAEQEKSVNSGALNASIRKLAPGAAVVVTQEVDAISCNPVGDNPGLVRADFNGDGRPDYAALLKIRETGKKTIWEGKRLYSDRSGAGPSTAWECAQWRNSKEHYSIESWRHSFLL